ncbi:uncharacterized protein LOC143286570 [Babylonia areolata]|uniref:uncharacterized protein LOC143286570 n=1 Tax=Babylonia areolata TaxID=304850 RepID=UPI003FCFFCC5
MPPTGLLQTEMDEETLLELEIQQDLERLNLDDDNGIADNDDVEINNNEAIPIVAEDAVLGSEDEGMPAELQDYIDTIQKQRQRIEEELEDCDAVIDRAISTAKGEGDREKALIVYDDWKELEEEAACHGMSAEEYRKKLLQDIENEPFELEEMDFLTDDSEFQLPSGSNQEQALEVVTSAETDLVLADHPLRAMTGEPSEEDEMIEKALRIARALEAEQRRQAEEQEGGGSEGGEEGALLAVSGAAGEGGADSGQLVPVGNTDAEDVHISDSDPHQAPVAAAAAAAAVPLSEEEGRQDDGSDDPSRSAASTEQSGGEAAVGTVALVHSNPLLEFELYLREQFQLTEERFRHREQLLKQELEARREVEEKLMLAMEEHSLQTMHNLQQEEQRLAQEKQESQRRLEKEIEKRQEVLEKELKQHEESIATLTAQLEEDRHQLQRVQRAECERVAQRDNKAATTIQRCYRGHRVRKLHQTDMQALAERKERRKEERQQQRIQEIELQIQHRKQEEERKAEEARREKEEEERKKEEEKRRQEEEERQRKEEEERKRKEEEEERKRKAEEEKKRKEEEERRLKEEQERKKKEEEERKKREEEERKRREEEERKRKEEEEEKKRKEEEERRRKEEEEEEERKRKEEEELRKQREEEEERKKKQEEAQKRLEAEEEKKRKEEEEQKLHTDAEHNKPPAENHSERGSEAKENENASKDREDHHADQRKEGNGNKENSVSQKNGQKLSTAKEELPGTGSTDVMNKGGQPDDSENGHSVSPLVIDLEPVNANVLPNRLEERRLGWMKSCLPWSKISNEPWKRKSGTGEKVPRRPASAKKLPPLPDNLILEAAKVASLKQVTTVELKDLPGHALSPLGACGHLKHLTVTRCGLIAVDGLSHCKHLQCLDVQDNLIEYVDLKELGSLYTLNLSHNKLSSVHGLEGCGNLRWLDVSHNRLTKLAGLAPLRRLHTLRASHNQLVSSKGLEVCPTVQHLDLSANYLTGVDGVEKLGLLLSLNASSNNLTQMPSLQNNVLLQELILRENSIGPDLDLSAAWLPLLFNLDLSQNIVEELTGSAGGLFVLKRLDLAVNQITDVSGFLPALSDCPRLEDLSLQGNAVLDEENLRQNVKNSLSCLLCLNGETLRSATAAAHPPRSFELMCMTQLQQHRDIKNAFDKDCRSVTEQGTALDQGPHTCDIHFKFCDKSFRLSVEHRYAHEYGELSSSSSSPNVPNPPPRPPPKPPTDPTLCGLPERSEACQPHHNLSSLLFLRLNPPL